MENASKLSIVIITFNEEKNIRRCLDSVKEVADEIIVVDSYSTDATEAICHEFGAKFSQNPFEGHIQQKNHAMHLASGDYILSLDADEALSDELKTSILKAKKTFTKEAYHVNRLTNYCGQWIHHSSWYPDRKLRLWKKGSGQWGGDNPHDKFIMEGEHSSEKLKGDLLHYSFYTVNQHIKQHQYFTDIAARVAYNKGKRSSILKLIIKPAFNFFSEYILRAGFLDGYYGYVICMNSAYANFLKYLKIYEIQRGKLDELK